MENFEEDLIYQSRKRFKILFYLTFTFFILLLIRLFYLQIIKGEDFYIYSLKNKIRKDITLPPRGRIYDRSGFLLADNIPRFDLVYIPQYAQKSTLDQLSNLLKIPKNNFLKTIKNYTSQARYLPIILKKNVSFEEIAKVENYLSELPGISIQEEQTRIYYEEEAFSSVLGYVALPNQKELENPQILPQELIGKSGLEKTYQNQLRGSPSISYSIIDAKGRKRELDFEDEFLKKLPKYPFIEGQNLKLTLDKDLQLKAYHSFKNESGGMIGLNPQTGEVLFLVSSPGFKGSQFAFGISKEDWLKLSNNPQKPLINKVFQEHYAPGSTFKPFPLITALEKKIISPYHEEYCTGSLKLKNRSFHCWRSSGHGSVNIIKSLRESCNNFYHKLGLKLNVDDLAHYSYLFGFGEKQKLNLGLESTGIVPTKEWKKNKFNQEWQLGDTLSVTIGQSYVTINILQLALAYSIIATKGRLMKPYLVQEFFTKKGFQQYSYPEEVKKIELKDQTWKLVQQGLYEVVNHPTGTAFKHRKGNIEASGKTGTAQVYSFHQNSIYQSCYLLEKNKRHHGLFVAYAPSDKPRIVVAMVLEHGCSGASTAPYVFNMIESYLKKYASF